MQTTPEEAAQWHQARLRRRRRGCMILLLAPLMVIGLILAWFGLRMFDRPTVTRDYLAELNEPLERVPFEDRAWPLYKQAVLLRLDHPMSADLQNHWPVYPGWKQWDEARAWARDAGPMLDLVRRGAERPMLGKPMSVERDEELARAEAEAGGWPYTPDEPSDQAMLIGVLLPELSYMRNWTRDLVTDTFAAMEDGDTGRAVENIEAMLGLAAHSADSRTIIGQLVQIAIEHVASQTVLRAVDGYPGAFSGDQLARLQAAFMTIGRGPMPAEGGLTRLTLDITLERLMFEDIVQRVYSDDGKGGGHMTLEGTKLFNEVASISGQGAAASVPIALLAASRQDLMAKYNEMMDRLESAADQWPWERADLGRFDAEVEGLFADPWQRGRYLLIALLAPAISKAVTTVDQANARRDGTIAALALVRWKAEHGSFPPSLEALTPAYLPRLPRDPVDGAPLRYRVTADGAVLYSLGADGDDDAGMRPENEHGALPGSSNVSDGDWVLYPILPADEPDDD